MFCLRLAPSSSLSNLTCSRLSLSLDSTRLQSPPVSSTRSVTPLCHPLGHHDSQSSHEQHLTHLQPLHSLSTITTRPHMSNQSLPPIVQVDASSISLALLVLGGYVCLIGQLSYILKEKLFISSALISICVGVGKSHSLSHSQSEKGKRELIEFVSCRTYWCQLALSLDLDRLQ